MHVLQSMWSTSRLPSQGYIICLGSVPKAWEITGLCRRVSLRLCSPFHHHYQQCPPLVCEYTHYLAKSLKIEVFLPSLPVHYRNAKLTLCHYYVCSYNSSDLNAPSFGFP